MTLHGALMGTAHILALTLIFQAVELSICSGQKSFFKIWSFKNLRQDLERGLPLPNALLPFIFSANAFRVILAVQVLAALASFLFPFFSVFLVLFLTHLLICIRFRGTFNGGSDMMIFVVLTGVLIVLASASENFQKLGLIYIAIHTLYSYFKAGFAKIIQADWRSGRALPAFLDRSLLPDAKKIARGLQGQSAVCFILCWSVLIFELAAIALPLFPGFVGAYFTLILLFHFGIYLSFGLNRFFWAWLCAWPAVFYSISLFR